MDVLNGYREFRREQDGITVPLRMEEWPADVPLPPNSKIKAVGPRKAYLLRPQLRYVMEPTCTIEVVTGAFQFGLPLDRALMWFRSELEKMGWVEDTQQGYLTAAKAGLFFQRAEKGIQLRLSLAYSEKQKISQVTLWRVSKYPWSPPNSNGARVNTRKRKPKPRAKPKSRKRTLAKRAVAKRTVAAAKRKV